MSKGGKREGAGRKPAEVKRESYYFRLSGPEYSKMEKCYNKILEKRNVKNGRTASSETMVCD